MAVNITDSGSTIKLEITSDYSQTDYPTIPAQTRYIEKSELSLKSQGNQVVIFDNETKFSFLYSDITTPSGASAVAVVGSIEAFQDAGGSAFGSIEVLTATITRPGDTTAYAAKDVVANSASAATILEFTGAARTNGGSGIIIGLEIETDQTANNAQYKLHPFTASPGTIINDNAPYVEKFADRSIRLTDIIIPALFNNGGTSNTAMQAITGLAIPYKCGASSTSLFAQLETLTVFTPANGQIYNVRLFVDRN